MNLASLIRAVPRDSSRVREASALEWLKKLKSMIADKEPPLREVSAFVIDIEDEPEPTSLEPPSSLDEAMQISVFVRLGASAFKEKDIGPNVGIRKLIAAVDTRGFTVKAWLELVQKIYISTSPALSEIAAKRADPFPWAAHGQYEDVRRHWRAVLYTTHQRNKSVRGDSQWQNGDAIAAKLLLPATSWRDMPPSTPTGQQVSAIIDNITETLTPYSPYLLVVSEIVSRIDKRMHRKIPKGHFFPAPAWDLWKDSEKLREVRLSGDQTTLIAANMLALGNELFTSSFEREIAWSTFIATFKERMLEGIETWAEAYGVPVVISDALSEVWTADQDIPISPLVDDLSGAWGSDKEILKDSLFQDVINRVEHKRLVETLGVNPYKPISGATDIQLSLRADIQRLTQKTTANREDPKKKWIFAMHAKGETKWDTVFTKLARINSTPKVIVVDNGAGTIFSPLKDTIYIAKTENGKFYEWGVYFAGSPPKKLYMSIPSVKKPKRVNLFAPSVSMTPLIDPSDAIFQSTLDAYNPLMVVWIVEMLRAGFTRLQIDRIPTLIDALGDDGYMHSYLESEFIDKRSDLFFP